ncbi:MAG TPA: glycosyltransferase [Candidatus Saccharimonadales bacterium]|nr:glycosyltransferase [Candidatus Saccharimonadales bacterium]
MYSDKRPLRKVGHIPALIHRTYHSNIVNQHMYKDAYQSWIKLNQNYTTIWNTLNQCEKDMEKMGERYFKAWRRLIPLAYKADLWRSCKLYNEGGIYIDAYTKPHMSLDDIIHLTGLKNEEHVFIATQDLKGIHNGFIITTPKHPFMKQYIEDMVHNIEYGKEDVLLTMTGPLCLEKSIQKVINKPNYKFKLGLNHQTYKFYLFHFNFGIYQYIDDNHKIILQKKYDFFHCYLYNYIYRFLAGTNYTYSYFTGKLVYDN